MIGLQLLQICARQVSPVTMSAIIQGESGGHPWSINVNGLPQGSMRFPNKQAAIHAATHYIRMGYKVDMGIAQVDSENLGWLHLSIPQAFDPCRNIHAAQTILLNAYNTAGAAGVRSLKGTFEAYNSGQITGDGHYAKVICRNAGVEVPAIPGGHLASWANHQVALSGDTKQSAFLPSATSPSRAPVRPVIVMPPKSWQPLNANEDFAVTGKPVGSGSLERGASSVTAIWNPA
jgi:type IV secretion system protein VirB1